jgi:hypothetical protein
MEGGFTLSQYSRNIVMNENGLERFGQSLSSWSNKVLVLEHVPAPPASRNGERPQAY